MLKNFQWWSADMMKSCRATLRPTSNFLSTAVSTSFLDVFFLYNCRLVSFLNLVKFSSKSCPESSWTAESTDKKTGEKNHEKTRLFMFFFRLPKRKIEITSVTKSVSGYNATDTPTAAPEGDSTGGDMVLV